MLRIVVTACTVLTAVTPLSAGRIDPERINQIIIQGRFATQQPRFTVVFSAAPLVDSRDRLVTSVTSKQLTDLKTTPDQVVLQLHSKPVSNSGRVDYFFGTAHDADKPWNNGDEFDWKQWESHSPDIWDHVCLVPLPERNGSGPVAVISSVTIRCNSQLLYDSRKSESYPNRKRIQVSLPATTITLRRGRLNCLNLSPRIQSFRNEYYELADDPLLVLAYSDLGQTERSKYANRGRNWCSEFCSYLYRENGIDTPDPNKADVNWKVIRDHFEQTGTGSVYPAREVAKWTDQQKLDRIRPGAFVSIQTSEEGTTHSLMFTTWMKEPGKRITRYTAVSGNNRGMVWAHSPLTLPTAEKTAGLSSEELATYDERVYFAVPDATSDR